MALIRVGMAELKTGGKGDVLQALGLGSCIGLVFFDYKSHVGGMVHIMLPDSAVVGDKAILPAKFANTGAPALLQEVLAAGAQRHNLRIKLAGGAEMFAFSGSDAPRLSIGKRNIEAVTAQLKSMGLRIDAQDVGGNVGRTFEVDLDSLACTIRVIGKEPMAL